MSQGGGSSGSSSGTQTVQTSQQIPQFEQQFAQSNQDLARSLGSQPYPTYQGDLVAGFTPTQQQGQQGAINAANSFQPALNAATSGVAPALGATQSGINAIGGALAASPNNPGVIQSYMSPYVQQALAPQITALQTQLGQQQNQIGAQATQANAFGDARQGSQSALANFYGNQSLSGLLGQGYNTAYSNALQTALGEQNVGLQGGQALSNIGLQGANQMANLGQLQQQLGLSGANAIYDVGQQQQQLNQQGLNAAYQQFQNQVQWPYQQLNVQESALSNSPYNMVNQVTLPGANTTASNLGMFASLAGLLGGSAGGAQAPFGGSAYNPSTALVG